MVYMYMYVCNELSTDIMSVYVFKCANYLVIISTIIIRNVILINTSCNFVFSKSKQHIVNYTVW